MLKAGCWKQETGCLVSHLFLFDQSYTALMDTECFFQPNYFSQPSFETFPYALSWCKYTTPHMLLLSWWSNAA